jgi:hypothetical protein
VGAVGLHGRGRGGANGRRGGRRTREEHHKHSCEHV